MTTKYKYFTMQNLRIANELAKKRNYNRQLNDNIYLLPLDTIFPITFNMLHEHACGVKVDPHVRCMIGVPEGAAFIDCDIELFNLLPVVEVPANA